MHPFLNSLIHLKSNRCLKEQLKSFDVLLDHNEDPNKNQPYYGCYRQQYPKLFVLVHGFFLTNILCFLYFVKYCEKK
jgi:hypothetical protein